MWHLFNQRTEEEFILLSCFDNNIHSLPVSIDLLGAGDEDVETIVSFIPGIVAEFVDFILNN